MKNACLKLSQGGLGNHLCQCLQFHVSTLLARCLTGDVWCLTLFPPPSPAPVHIASSAPPTGHCHSVPALISTCQVQILTWSQLTILNSPLPPFTVPLAFFQLTFEFYGPLNLLLVSLLFMYLHHPFAKTYSFLSYAKTPAINYM